MTGIINRLERAGYVTRRPDPTDRRRVRVASVPEAVARAYELYEPHYARLATLFAAYSPEQLALLTDWFTRTLELSRQSLEESRRRDQWTHGGPRRAVIPGRTKKGLLGASGSAYRVRHAPDPALRHLPTAPLLSGVLTGPADEELGRGPDSACSPLQISR